MNSQQPFTRSVFGAALVVAMAAAPALASSPEAWKEHDRAVVQTCIEASQLKSAKALGKPAPFSDDVGYTALLVQGRHAAPHMKNRPMIRVLCLFERRSGTAHVTEASDMGR